ncbi:MAG TPA: hypothetical protein DCE39_20835 [Planctomycetaceae bacterium]|nr:hypothetical protein [Planctomycetaceae bacterium]
MLKSILFLPDGYFYGMLAWLAAVAAAAVLLVKLRRGVSAGSRKWIHAGLSLWIVLVALTGVELYFAVVYDTTDSFSMTNVSKKWFAMHVEPHQRGLKLGPQRGILYRDDHDLPVDRSDEDCEHVVFVGDSFTFGHGVKRTGDRFSNRLAGSLEIDHPGRYSITNLSNAGVDLHWVERLLEELFAGEFPVDRVVYVVCLNDIETFHPRHKTYYVDLQQHAPRFVLWKHTYFFNLMYFRLRQFTVSDFRDYYQFVREYYDGDPWQAMQRKLDQVNRLCRSHGAKLEVVVFPFLHNLGPDYPFRDVHGQWAEWGTGSDVRVLDLLETLEPHAATGLTVNRYDAHPNERAHALAAEALRTGLFTD